MSPANERRTIPVVDSHVHVFPPDIVRNREGSFGGEPWFRVLYENPQSRLVTADDLLVSMDFAGVDVSVMCGFPWTDQGLVREHNSYMAEASRMHPDRLLWIAALNPNDANQAQATLNDALGKGARGCGELNADAQEFELQHSRELRAVAELCVDAQIPMMIHISEPVGHQYPGKGTATPEKLLEFLRDVPDLKVIAAHWGGGLPFYELMPEVADLTRNVVYDSAASTYLYDFRVFDAVMSLSGYDRVLFGSDYPVLKQDRFLARVNRIGWNDVSVRDAVLGGNALRMLGQSEEG